ncbi:MAG: YcaO-like family protein, partial [Pseudomonadota bacterium]
IASGQVRKYEEFYENILHFEGDEYIKKEIYFLSNLIKIPITGHIALFSATYGDCPAHFAFAFPHTTDATTPDWRHAWQLAGGRGRTLDDAIRGAIAEAAECLSAWSRGSDDPLVHPIALTDNPANAFADAIGMIGLSDRQVEELIKRHSSLLSMHSPAQLQFSDHINRFLQFQDKKTKKSRWVSSLCGLPGEENEYGISGERLTSTNGTAVAATFEEAADRAMFELIERDAVAIWWYNRIVRPRVSPAQVREICGSHLAQWLDERERRFHVLDVTSDIGVPVAAALSCEPDGSLFADGYASGRTPAEAIEGAVLEMLQAEVSLGFMVQKAALQERTTGNEDKSAFLTATQDINLMQEDFMLGASPDSASGMADIEVDAGKALTRLDEHGVEVLIGNVTRPDIGVPAARAVSPQLRDWRPRFAPGRLYDVPVTMGWLDAPNTEDTLNPRDFLT